MTTLTEFLEEYRITTVFRQARPHSSMTGGFKYNVRFTNPQLGKSATFEFHDSVHNRTHNGRATAAEVFGCLLEDASVAEQCSDADDVAEEFGVTVPSEATRIYNGCTETREKLRILLGPGLFAIAMQEVDRDI